MKNPLYGKFDEIINVLLAPRKRKLTRMKKCAFILAVFMVAFFSGCDHFDDPLTLTEGDALAILFLFILPPYVALAFGDRVTKKLEQRIDWLEEDAQQLRWKIEELESKTSSLESDLDLWRRE